MAEAASYPARPSFSSTLFGSSFSASPSSAVSSDSDALDSGAGFFRILVCEIFFYCGEDASCILFKF